jgi:hypothetical protein
MIEDEKRDEDKKLFPQVVQFAPAHRAAEPIVEDCDQDPRVGLNEALEHVRHHVEYLQVLVVQRNLALENRLHHNSEHGKDSRRIGTAVERLQNGKDNDKVTNQVCLFELHNPTQNIEEMQKELLFSTQVARIGIIDVQLREIERVRDPELVEQFGEWSRPEFVAQTPGRMRKSSDCLAIRFRKQQPQNRRVSETNLQDANDRMERRRQHRAQHALNLRSFPAFFSRWLTAVVIKSSMAITEKMILDMFHDFQ